MGDGLAALEEALVDGPAVDRIDQRLAHPLVLQDRVVEYEVDVLVEQARLIDHLVVVAMAFLEGERLVEREAELAGDHVDVRSEEHTSELQSLMRISYSVFCLKKKR